MPAEHVCETDVLVVGGGMSGIFAAMKARAEGMNVTLIDRSHIGHAGGVYYAEGFYSIFNPEWGHNLQDWMSAIGELGDYMNNPEWTEITLKESYDRYEDLVAWGVKFQTEKDGALRKVIYGTGPLEARLVGFGFTWLPILRERLVKSGVKLVDRLMVTDLLKQDGQIAGAVGFDVRDGEFYVFKAKATVVCAPGTGEALGFRAGAEIGGKEFLLAGIGPFSYIGHGDYVEKGAPKVSIEGKEVKPAPGWDGGTSPTSNPYIDAEGNRVSRYTMLWALHDGRAPMIWNLDAVTPEEMNLALDEIAIAGTNFKIERMGFDLKKRGLYQRANRGTGGMSGAPFGGVAGLWSTDTQGGTTLPGLFGAGDAYSSRNIGAKYPCWGFALRNASVTGARAGRTAAIYASQARRIQVDEDHIARLKSDIYAPLDRAGGFHADWVQAQLLGATGPYYMSAIRHGERMKAALTLVQFLRNHVEPKMYVKPKDAHGLAKVHDIKTKLLCSETALQASIFRTDSRGLSFREDYPFRDDPDWLAAVKIRPSGDGGMELVKVPFPKQWWPDLSIPYRERYPLEYPNEQVPLTAEA